MVPSTSNVISRGGGGGRRELANGPCHYPARASKSVACMEVCVAEMSVPALYSPITNETDTTNQERASPLSPKAAALGRPSSLGRPSLPPSENPPRRGICCCGGIFIGGYRSIAGVSCARYQAPLAHDLRAGTSLVVPPVSPAPDAAAAGSRPGEHRAPRLFGRAVCLRNDASGIVGKTGQVPHRHQLARKVLDLA